MAKLKKKKKRKSSFDNIRNQRYKPAVATPQLALHLASSEPTDTDVVLGCIHRAGWAIRQL